MIRFGITVLQHPFLLLLLLTLRQKKIFSKPTIAATSAVAETAKVRMKLCYLSPSSRLFRVPQHRKNWASSFSLQLPSIPQSWCSTARGAHRGDNTSSFVSVQQRTIHQQDHRHRSKVSSKSPCPTLAFIADRHICDGLRKITCATIESIGKRGFCGQHENDHLLMQRRSDQQKQQRSLNISGTSQPPSASIFSMSTTHFASSPSSFSVLRILRGGDVDGNGSCGITTRCMNASASVRAAAPNKLKYRVFVAVGSNLGNRYQNIATAIQLLCSSYDDINDSDGSKNSDATRLLRTSYLHETAPMYVTDQPPFLNGVIEIETKLSPQSLIQKLKSIEKDLGRNFRTRRNGPRVIDLDILLYYDQDEENARNEEVGEVGANVQPTSPIILEDTSSSLPLIIPHPRIAEREFVLQPLCEVAGHDFMHPTLNAPIGDLLSQLLLNTTEDATNSPSTDCSAVTSSATKSSSAYLGPSAIRMLPLPNGRQITFNETIIMGILNVTPDSFSDGGRYTSTVDSAVRRALEMISEGAHIIDIGGESTRPGAKEVSIDEQIQRTVPVIRKLRKVLSMSPSQDLQGQEDSEDHGIRGRVQNDVVISIDTRHAEVAKAAILAGADIVNDVSGGKFDRAMLPTVSDLGVPIILMHMRGIPETMQSMTSYQNVVDEVAAALLECCNDAANAGIPKWLQVLDPGIGFAKDIDGNLLLLKHYNKLRALVQNAPLLLGTSRKGFIGKISNEEIAENRDFGTVASCIAALCLGSDDGTNFNGIQRCNILRVHNVKGAKQATLIMDAITNAK